MIRKVDVGSVFGTAQRTSYEYMKLLNEKTNGNFKNPVDTIPKANIHTIGDGFNDQGMIEEFNGYAISSAKQPIIDISKGIYDSVGELADDIRRKRI